MESDQLLLTLTRCLLSSPYPGGRAEDVQILVGELPANLPIALPLPQNASVIGSLVRLGHSAQIVLDVDQSVKAVVAFYREQLVSASWRELDSPIRFGGFSFPSEAANLIFCKSQRGPALTVTCNEITGALTEVRLNLQLDARHTPCAMVSMRGGPLMPPIPNLRTPAGARWRGGGSGGGGSDDWHSTVNLETDLDAAALIAHYNEQLQSVGWNLRDQGRSGSSAWSAWRFSDDQHNLWAGVLIILDSIGKTGERFAYLHVELLPEGGSA